MDVTAVMHTCDETIKSAQSSGRSCQQDILFKCVTRDMS
jgi:hypothetical protein